MAKMTVNSCIYIQTDALSYRLDQALLIIRGMSNSWYFDNIGSNMSWWNSIPSRSKNRSLKIVWVNAFNSPYMHRL